MEICDRLMAHEGPNNIWTLERTRFKLYFLLEINLILLLHKSHALNYIHIPCSLASHVQCSCGMAKPELHTLLVFFGTALQTSEAAVAIAQLPNC